jgi:hypothetical protein
MKTVVGDRKRRRKKLRAVAREKFGGDYRDDVRALIASMRWHNEHASAEDRYSEHGFRIALRRMRHEFSAKVKASSVVPQVRA